MSIETSRSYLSVAYDLRPAKQVERRMLLDFFRRLSGAGTPVESYHYTGMGSIHFIDHILFHKFLGIDRLVSVERDDDIEQRIRFNQPFSSVQIEIMEIGEYIPRLKSGVKHIVWLDYDYRLSQDMIKDVRACAATLSTDSFVLVTVDVEPPKNSTGARCNFESYRKVASNLWDPSWKPIDFTRNKLHLRARDLIANGFREGAAGRPEIEPIPCFYFVYADGHRMATLGIQMGGPRQAECLQNIKASGADYLVLDFLAPPFQIDVPVLTRRERPLLEGAVPAGEYYKVRDTGVGEDEFRKFERIYRFLPSYGELLLG